MKRNFSLTARLTILFAIISTALLSGVAFFILSAVERHFVAMDREELEGKIELVSRDIAALDSENKLVLLPGRLHDALIGHPHLLVAVAFPNGKLVFAWGDEDIPPAYLATSPAAFDWQGTHSHFIGVAKSIATPIATPASLTVAVATDTAPHDHFLMRLTDTIIAIVALAALLSGALGWLAARKGLAPLEAMKQRTSVVTARKLDLRLPVETVPIEMAGLAESLNAMLERLEQAFERLSNFSSDLAHELRTPISNLMMQTQVALSRARTNEDYRDTLASNAEEFERLSRMISDMLFLAKADHGLMLPSREDIDLAAESRNLFDYYDALADSLGVTFTCTGNATLYGDRLMIRRALSNLLSNALRHTPKGGVISVEIESGNETAPVVTVANPGLPIPADQLPRIFKRFYRSDDARKRDDSTGSGLGLAIVQAIVVAHGGTIEVSSNESSTRFTMTFSGG
jgi:two-component system heavy metal sensor histidine kinase CusS